MADNVICVDFRARAGWDRAITRQFVHRWQDAERAEDGLMLWCQFMDRRRSAPADAAPEVWDYLWALFLRTEGVREMARAKHGAA